MQGMPPYPSRHSLENNRISSCYWLSERPLVPSSIAGLEALPEYSVQSFTTLEGLSVYDLLLQRQNWKSFALPFLRYCRTANFSLKDLEQTILNEEWFIVEKRKHLREVSPGALLIFKMASNLFPNSTLLRILSMFKNVIGILQVKKQRTKLILPLRRHIDYEPLDRIDS